MSRYRRLKIEGGAFFFTLALADRGSDLLVCYIERTACPQEPIAGRNGRADCRRKQHRHPLRLALVPHRDEGVGILEDLLFGRTARSRFLLGCLPAPVLHFAAIESHAGIVVEWEGVSMSLWPQERTFDCNAISVALGQNLTHAVQRRDGYSITSSASDRRLSVSLMPSVLAVLRLITSSNFVGCMTGRSVVLSPLRMRPT
jgi:hypothetical protein